MTVDHKNPSEIVQIAKHGRGWAKMITEQELLELYKLSAENGVIVDGIEPFNIEGDLEIPYVHLTLNSNEIHESLSHLNWTEKISEMGRIIETMLAEAAKSGGEFRFNAWVSKEEYWVPKG